MKKINSMFFTALLIGVLCAGTVSARQLLAERRERLGHLWRQLRRQQSLPHRLPLHLPHGNGQSLLFVASHSGRNRVEVTAPAVPVLKLKGD